MLDTTGMAAGDGFRVASSPPLNGTSACVFLSIFRLASGFTDRSAITNSAGQAIWSIGNTTNVTKTRAVLDLYSDGGVEKLRCALLYNLYQAKLFTLAELGLSSWSELEDKICVVAIQYINDSTPHRAAIGFWNGSSITYAEGFAPGNPTGTGVPLNAAPNYVGCGDDGMLSAGLNPFVDFMQLQIYHDEVWISGSGYATFQAVVESVIDSTDGSLKSLAGPGNLVTGTRAGASNLEFVFPLLRDVSSSFQQRNPGDQLTDGLVCSLGVKSTGYTSGTVTIVGSGGPILVDPEDIGFTPDPDAVSPASSAVGSRGQKLDALVTGTYTSQVVVSSTANSRNGRSVSGRGNDAEGVAVVMKSGHSLNSTQFPNQHADAGSSYGDGLALNLIDDVIGCISLMPQTSWFAGSTPRRSQICVDVASASGSSKTATVLDGSADRHNNGAQRLSLWDDFGDADPQMEGCGQPIYIAPGQYVDLWFNHAGAMDPEGSRTLMAFFAQMPTNVAGTTVTIQPRSHGSISIPASYPGASPDWEGTAHERTIQGVLRGSNNNPTVATNSTDVTVPAANTTGDAPEIGDICILSSATLSPHAISQFETAPDGAGAATFTHNPHRSSVMLISPTLSWGPYSVVKHEIGIQIGETGADGPFVGMRIAVDAGESAGVYLLAWGVRQVTNAAGSDSHGLIFCHMGQGGAGYARQVDELFNAVDGTGRTPYQHLLSEINPGIHFLFPAEQSSVAADAQDMIDLVSGAVPSCEIVRVAPTRYVSTFFTGPTVQSSYFEWMTDNVPAGEVGVDVSGSQSALHALMNGEFLDSEHLGPRGVERVGAYILTQLESLPVAAIASGDIFGASASVRSDSLAMGGGQF